MTSTLTGVSFSISLFNSSSLTRSPIDAFRSSPNTFRATFLIALSTSLALVRGTVGAFTAYTAFDYLHEPLVDAGFEVDILDLCFSEDLEQSISEYVRYHDVDFWGVTLRNTDDVYFSSQHSCASPASRGVSEAVE